MLGFGVEAGVVLLTPIVRTWVTREAVETPQRGFMKSVQLQSLGSHQRLRQEDVQEVPSQKVKQKGRSATTADA